MLKANCRDSDGRERMKAWKQLSAPKPSWEMFKRMCPVFNNDAEKIRQAWIKNQQLHGIDVK